MGVATIGGSRAKIWGSWAKIEFFGAKNRGSAAMIGGSGAKIGGKVAKIEVSGVNRGLLGKNWGL